MTPGPVLLKPAEYARRIGVNRSTVTRQVQSGLIPAHDGMIDPVEADAARKANLDTAKQRLAVTRRPTLQTSITPAPSTSSELPADLLVGLPEEPDAVDPQDGTLKAAQIKERRAKASLAEIELARLRRELVPLQEVEQLWGNAIVNARTRLFLMVDEIQSPTIRAQVERRLREILADLAHASAATPGEAVA